MANDIRINVNVKETGLDSVSAKMVAFERQQKQIDRAFKIADAQMNQNKITGQQYTNIIQKLNTELAELSMDATSAGNSVATLGEKTENAAAKMNRMHTQAQMGRRRMSNFSMGVMQAGFQVQDLTVQLQGGQDALLAIGQQGSQMLGFFGPKGAIAGAVLALGAAIIGTTMKAKNLAVDWTEIGRQMGQVFEPLMPAVDLVVEAFGWMGNFVLEVLTNIINQLSGLIHVVAAMPQAFSLAFDAISMKVSAWGARMQATIDGVRASIIGVMDTINNAIDPSIGPRMNPFNPNQTLAESYQLSSDAGHDRADAMSDAAADMAKDAAGVFVDAWENAPTVDFSKWLKDAGKPNGKGGKGPKDVVDKEVQEMQKILEGFYNTVESSMETFFLSITKGTESLEDAFKTMIANVITEFYKLFVLKPMIDALLGGLGGSLGIGGGPLGMLGQALGSVVTGGAAATPTTTNGSALMTPGSVSPAAKSVTNVVINNNGNGDEYLRQTSARMAQQVVQQATPQITKAASQQVIRDRRAGGAMKTAFG